MDYIFDQNQPIYLQILHRMYAKILRGEFHSGDKLPSVVDTAILYKVNHNTIARVYSEMVRSGIAVIRRGEGTFVTEDKNVLYSLHISMRRTQLENFFTEMHRLGYSTPEIMEAIEQFIQENLVSANHEEEK